MYKPSVIFIDLDGTSLDHKTNDGRWRASQRLINIIEKINQKIPVVVLTGRGENAETFEILEQMKIKNAILWNGAKIFANKKEIYSQSIKKEVVEQLFDLAKKEEATIVFNSLMNSYTYTTSAIAQKDLWERRKVQILPDDFKPNFDVYKVAITSNTNRTIQDFIKEWKLIFNDELTITDTGVRRTFLEITGKNVNKGTGAAKYCEFFNLDLSKSMHIGDSMNDSFVKGYVGTVIALKGSVPEFIEISDQVTKNEFDNFGLAEFLENNIDLNW
ncbi:HAD-IIB family hydrolase [Mycoplasmopsis pullorum]|uniref:Haloacid dehalogenase n=1 Tax=Mycoplasmopsis pullorum TaxID=48003 RepID=A0A1L4FS96_9BACT|nr:HAD-IIB family hydrolase [Mycoplasmopsis pullorum]APJ38478.1 hypothetical protein BLA55_02290 [Mycoplasmopsis pullorum]